MLYNFFRPFVFRLEAEKSHAFSLNVLDKLDAMRLLTPLAPNVHSKPVTLMGLTFPNPVGLAAGLDKNADHINALSKLGFGFLEVGTVTPRPQNGHPKPRLFRLPEAQAIINRMGFNNKGVAYLVEQVKRAKYHGVLGINIGKNAQTPNEKAVDDYLFCYQQVFPYASYIVINISSPNTANLRDLQIQTHLIALLDALKTQQQRLSALHGHYVPLVIKVAPDLSKEEVQDLGSTLLKYEIDGVIATNTSNSRQGVESSPLANKPGGLSGKPIAAKSTETVAWLFEVLQGKLPIIAVGGIVSAEDAKEKFLAGAQLIQLYTGLIYKGPQLISDAVKAAPID